MPAPRPKRFDFLPRSAKPGTILAICWITVAACSLIRSAAAQVVDPDFPGAHGPVYASLLRGDTLYVGGDFTFIGGRHTGAYASIDVGTGEASATWPRVEGVVRACAPDGHDGWYIGGSFSSVSGVARTNLAHLRADGSLSAWSPSTNSHVHAIAVGGGTVYIGGSFTQLNGSARAYTGAVEAAGGGLLEWNPGMDSTVYTLRVSGPTVYAGGSFANAGGQPRAALAAVDTAGPLRSWDPGANGVVRTLAAIDTAIYAGGSFTLVSGQPRNRLAAIGAEGGALLPWDPDANGTVQCLLPVGSTLFAGGSFGTVGTLARGRVAAIDAVTGSVLAWTPATFFNTVYSLATDGVSIFAGGAFPTVAFQRRLGLAAVDIGSGALTPWLAHTDGSVFCLGLVGSKLFAGGSLARVGLVERNKAAAIERSTGSVLDWNPNVNNAVWAMAGLGSSIFLGGNYSTVGGSSRMNLAAVGSADGALLPWNPSANSSVLALAATDSSVFVGGSFSAIGAVTRQRVAKLDAVTGALRSWDPAIVGFTVESLLPTIHGLFIGGAFDSVGGQPRGGFAKVDAVTAAVLPTAFSANKATVSGLLEHGSKLLVGGGFFGGLATVNAATGAQMGFTPQLDFQALRIGFQWAHDLRRRELRYRGWTSSPRLGGARRNDGRRIAMGPRCFGWDPGPPGGRTDRLRRREFRDRAGGRYAPSGLHRGSIGVSGCVGCRLISRRRGVARIGHDGGAGVVGIGRGAPRVQSVDLHLSRSGPTGPWELIAAGLANTGVYGWTVAGATSADAWLRVDARDFAGALSSATSAAAFAIVEATTGVGSGTGPRGLALAPLVPNPVRGPARQAFELPARMRVRLSLIDVQGRQVSLLADEERDAGRHVVNMDTSRLRPGVYMIRLQTPHGTRVRRALILH